MVHKAPLLKNLQRPAGRLVAPQLMGGSVSQQHPLSLQCLLLGVAWIAVAGPAVAQEPAASCKVRGSFEWLSQRGSPLDSAMVVIGGNVAKVCYSRPSARGRTVFGGLIPYGKAWRTGANEPTVLHLPFPAEVAGVRLDAGRYMLFTVPQPERWVIAIFISDATDPVEMFQTMRSVGEGMVVVESLETHVETFTIRGTTGAAVADLILEWERVRVRIPIRPID